MDSAIQETVVQLSSKGAAGIVCLTLLVLTAIVILLLRSEREQRRDFCTAMDRSAEADKELATAIATLTSRLTANNDAINDVAANVIEIKTTVHRIDQRIG